MYDIQSNAWGHSTDICWGLPFLFNCERIQRENSNGTETTHKMKIDHPKASTTEESWWHSPYVFGWQTSYYPAYRYVDRH